MKMKRGLSLLIVLLMFVALMPPLTVSAAGSVPISERYFPDPVFREFVRQYDLNKNGTLSARELSEVKFIGVWTDKHVQDLTGIEWFTAAEFLEVGGHGLKSIDVSKNKALKSLDVSYNELRSLNLRHNPNLTNLTCNINYLSELDLSHNRKIEYLDCSDNYLEYLNVRSLSELKNLTVTTNFLSGLNLTLDCGRLRQ